MSQAYRQAGVDLEAGAQAVASMAEAVSATYTDEVLSKVGSFGGLFDAGRLVGLKDPVLVASTDGVGTKVKVAQAMGRWDSIGRDLVHHCINDILVQGARPLFFLDFLGCEKLVPEQAAAVVGGVARACGDYGCPLLGGETAEMADVYREGQLELVGTIVGVVPRAEIIDGSRLTQGDVLLAWPSSGLHTNGYTLARKVLADLDWNEPNDQLGCSIGQALLAVHRCYLDSAEIALEAGIDLKGLAHITGGGIPGNLSRIMPEGLTAEVDLSKVVAPPIFDLIAETGSLERQDMLAAFNLGVGMIAVVPAEQARRAREVVPEWIPVGQVVAGHEMIVR